MKKAIILSLLILLFGCGKKEKAKGEAKKQKDIAVVDSVEKKAETEIIPEVYQYRYDSLLADKNVGDYWNTYKRVRAVAKELGQSGEYEKANDSLLLAAECMIKVKELGIASWQFNNAGKNSIDLFMEQVSYQEKVSKINEMIPGDEKSAFIKDVQKEYIKYLSHLKWGKLYLQKAYDCNEDEFDKKREKAIENNIAFIKEIEKFLEI